MDVTMAASQKLAAYPSHLAEPVDSAILHSHTKVMVRGKLVGIKQ